MQNVGSIRILSVRPLCSPIFKKPESPLMMWIVKDSVDIHAYMQCTQGMRLSPCAD